MGVTKVIGHFKGGDVVGIVDEDNNAEFAKGNPNYTSDELNMIKGLKATEIMKKLGYARPKEVIGRKKIHLATNEEQ